MKKLVPTNHNASFHLAKGGILTIYASPDFRLLDMKPLFRMAILHAKWKHIKKPEVNKSTLVIVPTLEAA